MAQTEGADRAPTDGRGPSRRRLPPRRWLLALVAVLVAVTTIGVVVIVRGSSSSMPVGDLPGWRQVFADDFDQDVPLGSFPGSAYRSRWIGYEGLPDTSGAGRYSNDRVVSVSDGIMDMYLRTEDGVPLVAAPSPLVDGKWGGQTYGRYSVRFRADAVEGYKTAWLLWPDSDKWAHGEVDFPEGPLDGSMYAANLCVGQPGTFCYKSGDLATFTEWHVATIEWTPRAVTFYLDGREVGSSDSVPRGPMHWVLQTETDHGRPPASSAGHVQVDWVTIYTYDPASSD